MADDPREAHLAGQSRLVAIVIAATMVLWLGGQYLGGAMGWQPRFAFLIDLAALAGFVWALIVTFRIWRARRGN
jgi:hypothetical protein